jgi:hypothetical protein
LPILAYYISGHGFGHAARAREIILTLMQLRPDCTIHMRTRAPARLLPSHRSLPYGEAELDSGMVESQDALRIDPAATVATLQGLLSARDSIVDSEARFLRANRVALVLADIPFLAGPASAAAGVPCIGISNFTWNWILEPLLGDRPEVLRLLEEDYSAMQALYQLPFGHQDGLKMFPRVRQMPLVSGHPCLSREEVRRRCRAGAPRMVWLAMRGKLNPDVVQRAARQSSDTLFLTTDDTLAAVAPNLCRIEINSSLGVADVVKACDAVVGKLGYSLVAECVAAKVPLIHVPRTGFREDEITRRQAPLYTVLHEMPVRDFDAGRWPEHIEAALAMPVPGAAHPAGGAQECARLIGELL